MCHSLKYLTDMAVLKYLWFMSFKKKLSSCVFDMACPRDGWIRLANCEWSHQYIFIIHSFIL